jgi:hypothetical protein
MTLFNKKIVILASILFAILSLTIINQSGRVLAQNVASPSPMALVVPTEQPQAGMNVTLAPSFLNLTTDPGTPVTSQLKIKNNNNFSEYLEFELAKFEASEDGEKPRLLEVGPEEEFIKWLSFSEPQVMVGSNETKSVKFTISPPKEASLGYYYAILVKRMKVNSPEAGQTVIAGAPAFLVLMEVRSPNAKRELQIVDFKTDNLVYEYLPAEFLVKVKNSGNIHLAPAGDIFIDWGGKKDVGIIRANEGRGNILPGTERTYLANWSEGFPVRIPKTEGGKEVRDENGQVAYSTKWDFSQVNKFRIGKYTAHLLMVYDNGQRDIPVEATVSFWVLPWKILGGAAVILILVLLGLKSTISSSVKKIRRR